MVTIMTMGMLVLMIMMTAFTTCIPGYPSHVYKKGEWRLMTRGMRSGTFARKHFKFCSGLIVFLLQIDAENKGGTVVFNSAATHT